MLSSPEQWDNTFSSFTPPRLWCSVMGVQGIQRASGIYPKAGVDGKLRFGWRSPILKSKFSIKTPHCLLENRFCITLYKSTFPLLPILHNYHLLLMSGSSYKTIYQTITLLIVAQRESYILNKDVNFLAPLRVFFRTERLLPGLLCFLKLIFNVLKWQIIKSNLFLNF